MEVYKQLFVGVDSTATQKNTAETINALMFDKDEFNSPLEGREEDIKGVKEDKMENIFGEYFNLKGCPKISGLDFSGGRKPAYLVSANFMLEARLFRWPMFFTGMRSQLSNYDPAKDRAGVPKIPQDIVCCFSMGSFVIRKWFYVNLKDEENEIKILKGMICVLAGLQDYLLVLAAKEVPQDSIPKRQYVRASWRNRRSIRP